MPLRSSLTGVCVLLVTVLAQGQETVQEQEIGLIFPPYYDYLQGPSVNVGPVSGYLSSWNLLDLQVLVEEMDAKFGQADFLVEYVTAIRLYDLAQRDDAVFWFYTALFHTQLFGNSLRNLREEFGDPAYEHLMAGLSFAQNVGEYITGYAVCDKEMWLSSVDRVLARTISPPDFEAVYPDLRFVNERRMQDAVDEVRARFVELRSSIDAEYETLRATAVENGLIEDFCFEADDPADFAAVVDAFHEAAKAEDIDAMVALTSQVTIDQIGGDEAIRADYVQDKMRALRQCSTLTDPTIVQRIPLSQSETGAGWAFRRACIRENAEPFDLDFAVLREEGELVLTSMVPGE